MKRARKSLRKTTWLSSFSAQIFKIKDPRKLGSFCAMKRPAQRGQGKQVHRCSVCSAVGHRINTCSHPAASKIRSLLQTVRKLSKGKSAKRVIRQESKNRLSKQDKRVQHIARQKKAYSGQSQRRQPAPTEIRRNKPRVDLAQDALDSQPNAVAWLLKKQFIHRPSRCDECGKRTFYEVMSSPSNAPHWRCKCGKRFGYLGRSLFNGMKVSPVLLVQLLLAYVKADLQRQCKVPDLVQSCGASKSQVLNFLSVMRELEARAGAEWKRRVHLKGDIECDATGFGNFYVKPDVRAFASEVARLNARQEAKGKPKPKSFLVSLQVLGAMDRKSDKAVLHLSAPRVPGPRLWFVLLFMFFSDF